MSYIPGLFPGQQPERLIYEVREAASGGDRRSLARLPWRLYRGDRYWKPPSRRSRVRSLSPKYNPSLKQVSLALFVAEAQNGVLGAEIIGGIAVWLPADSQGSSIAHFGMFEVANNPEVAETLIEAAESWLVEQFPIEVIRGPFSLDGRQPPGLLTDGFNIRTAPGLPYNPPYYPEIIEGAGYAPFQTARTYLVPARTSSAPPEVRLIGETRTGFCITWEEDGQTLEAMIVSPDALGPSSRLPEQLLHLRMLRRSGRRLLARPAGDSVGPEWDDRRLALWRAVAGVAARLGYDEVLLGPIPDDEKMIRDALVTLGARPAHTYQVFEKAF